MSMYIGKWGSLLAAVCAASSNAGRFGMSNVGASSPTGILDLKDGERCQTVLLLQARHKQTFLMYVALKDTLQARGVLGQIRAKIRAEIYHALDEVGACVMPLSPLKCKERRTVQDVTSRATMSNENLLINELIREYLEFNNYKHTLAVLLPGRGLLT